MRQYLAFSVLALALLAACTSTSVQNATNKNNVDLFAPAISAASEGVHRSRENIARNRYRHPVETLEFFGLQQAMTVLEISPGGMWYTEVLAPVLKDKGKLIVAGYDVSVENQPKYRYRQQREMEARFVEQAEIYDAVDIVKFSPPDSVQLGESASVDMVLTFRNFHGWIRDGVAPSNMQAFFDVLKPGGVLGVVQHRTDKPSLLASGKINGYVSEDHIIRMAEKVGFTLEARSEINANSNDNRRHPEGVWTLPPTLRMGDEDRDIYLKIGESDRMTLRFRKNT